MSFLLLEIAMQAVASCDAIGPDLSDAPENQPGELPEMSDRRGDGCQMQDSKSETGLPARGNGARAMQRPVVSGRWWVEEESN
jgi:hypothetical protein